MYISTLKISSKGQIVLPKKIRSILKSDVIMLEVNDNSQIVLSPLPDLSGALFDYKQNNSPSFNKIREDSWRENTRKSNKDIKGEEE